MNALSFILTNNKSWTQTNFVWILTIYQSSFLVIQLIIMSLMNIFENKKIKKTFSNLADFTEISANGIHNAGNMYAISFICFLFQIPAFMSQLILSTEGYGVFVFICAIVYVIISLSHLIFQIKLDDKLHIQKFEKTKYIELNRLKNLYRNVSYKPFRIKYKNKVIKRYDKRSKFIEFQLLVKEKFILERNRELLLNVKKEDRAHIFKNIIVLFNEICPMQKIDEFFLDVFYEYLKVWSAFFNKKNKNLEIQIIDDGQIKTISVEEFKQVIFENLFALLFNRKSIDRNLFYQAQKDWEIIAKDRSFDELFFYYW
ncbi:hypothetical protein [Mycoplasma yeatsii]|uniref:Uncharacterized protein n=1 Tax=Mycoplasma yeatsii TaxID=51365 RepID=A0ABU0NDF0_9MOLU|nr:hypothetical protein [Mycoplasma yeatsii]MDQ0567476.1 hypothetical protein [Mycoplasma yeatsii]